MKCKDCKFIYWQDNERYMCWKINSELPPLEDYLDYDVKCKDYEEYERAICER